MRTATADDAALLLPLYESFYGGHFRPKTVEAVREHLIAASMIDTVLVAELAGEPVGFASLRILPQVENDLPHAELSDLFVVEGHRRRGVGRALLAAAEGLAATRGSPWIVLVTGFENGGARDFYRALGFEDHALQMKKDLGGSR